MCATVVENADYLDGTQDENLIILVTVNFFSKLEHFRIVLRMCPVRFSTWVTVNFFFKFEHIKLLLRMCPVRFSTWVTASFFSQILNASDLYSGRIRFDSRPGSLCVFFFQLWMHRTCTQDVSGSILGLWFFSKLEHFRLILRTCPVRFSTLAPVVMTFLCIASICPGKHHDSFPMSWDPFQNVIFSSPQHWTLYTSNIENVVKQTRK